MSNDTKPDQQTASSTVRRAVPPPLPGSVARRALGVWLAAAMLLSTPSCDDPVRDVEDDTAVDVVDLGEDLPVGTMVRALFDLEAARSGDFYDFPFPSDVRVDAMGRPDLEGLPTSGVALVTDGLAFLQEDVAGFTPNGAAYFRFDGALDPAVFPDDPGAALEDGAIAHIVDIDPDSPTFGDKLPAYIAYRARSSDFWRSHTVTVRTVPGLSMRPATRYAVVITDALLAEDGTPVAPAESFEALLAGEDVGASELSAEYEDIFLRLEEVGIDTSRLVSATAYTTSDPAAQMDALAESVRAQPLPAVTDWEKESEDVYIGRFETTEFFGPGEAPYNGGLGEGAFEFDAEGKPIGGSSVSVQFAISVPTDPPPPSGFPIVVYGHGTGGGHRSHLGSRGEGAWLTTEGVATIGFDAALHGDRVDSDFDVETLIAANPVAAREVVRQTVVDMIIIYRLLAEGAFDIPGSVTGGDPITFDPSFGLYMGHSQGSQEAGVLLGVEPAVKAAFLSAGGAGAVISVLERDLNGQPAACALALAIGIVDCSEITAEHPVLMLAVQPLLDPADPLNYARRFIKEPPPGFEPSHIVMSEGTTDKLTPPATQEALAMAIGLPLVEPVVRTSDAIELVDPPREMPPVSLNIETGAGTVTGGLLQWLGEGHFAIYDSGDARNRYLEFFRTAAEGNPTIVGPR